MPEGAYSNGRNLALNPWREPPTRARVVVEMDAWGSFYRVSWFVGLRSVILDMFSALAVLCRSSIEPIPLLPANTSIIMCIASGTDPVIPLLPAISSIINGIVSGTDPVDVWFGNVLPGCCKSVAV